MTIRARALLAAGVLAAGVGLAVPADATAPTATYLVTTTAASPAQTLVEALGGRVGFTYRYALHGFSVTLPVPALAALRVLPGVENVEPSHVIRVQTTQTNPPSYGLDRIDQRTLPLNHAYTYTASGAGVTAYVIDTGITYDHVDFGGRARPGFDAVTQGGGAVDCNGHGTHVSGTIGGTTYGVAKRVSLVGVRVLDCNGSGTTDEVVAGIDWVAGHAVKPAVANMSLGGGTDDAIDAAVNGAIDRGVTFAVAAGNDASLLGDLLGYSNACNHSPARVPAAITVAATDSTDTQASYSNSGSCVDLYAPGTDITSDWYDSRTSTNTISGTSMATPHVTGTAALYLSGHRGATPAQVQAALVGAATTNVVQGASSDTPNRLLFEAW